MDQSRAAILRAAREQLEAKGYRQWTMASLAAQSAVTRQTVHNLFGTKSAVLEALFDVIALDGGIESMREVMTLTSPAAMLQGYVEVFCRFWASNRLLIRRIRAIDPEFGSVIQDRNNRRFRAAMRIVSKLGCREDAKERAAALAALTSFEFFDALVENLPDEKQAIPVVLEMTRKLFTSSILSE
jgi:AcrR family transcriptional regulator